MAILILGVGVGLAAMHTLLAELAAERASLSPRKRFVLTGVVGAYLITWLAAAITFGDRTNFPLDREQLRLPLSVLVAFGPMLLGMAALFLSRTLRRVNSAMPATWLIWAQTYRMVGLMFLFPYMYYGIVPASFALPAGLGDFLTGALAPVVALAVARRQAHATTWATVWNLFGILDLTVAVTMGFLTSPSAIAPIVVHPSSELITMLPMVMIAVYMVPLSIVLHIASLVKLRRDEAHVARGSGLINASA
jgi:hypothetical protein